LVIEQLLQGIVLPWAVFEYQQHPVQRHVRRRCADVELRLGEGMGIAAERDELALIYRSRNQGMWRKLGNGIKREQKKKENRGDRENPKRMGAHANSSLECQTTDSTVL
jgi:uncharacterized protein (DUF1015 family)